MPPRRSPAPAKSDTLIAIGELKMMPATLMAIDAVLVETIDRYHRAAFPEQYAQTEDKKRGLYDEKAKSVALVAICLTIEAAQKAIVKRGAAAPPEDIEKINEWIGLTPDVTYPFVYMSAAARHVAIECSDDDVEAIVRIVSPLFAEDDIGSVVSEVVVRYIRLIASHVSNTSHAAMRRINADKMMAIMRNIDRLTPPGERASAAYFKQLTAITLTMKKKKAPAAP